MHVAAVLLGSCHFCYSLLMFSDIPNNSNILLLTDNRGSQQDIRGSGGSLSQSGRGGNWQGQRTGGSQGIQDRGRDGGSKNFSRNQTGGILKSKNFLGYVHDNVSDDSIAVACKEHIAFRCFISFFKYNISAVQSSFSELYKIRSTILLHCL